MRYYLLLSVRGLCRDEIFTYYLCFSRRGDALVPMTAGHGRFIFKICRSHDTNAKTTTTTPRPRRSPTATAALRIGTRFRSSHFTAAWCAPLPFTHTSTRLHERINANRVRVTSRRGSAKNRTRSAAQYQEKTKRINTLQRYKCVRVCACTAETNRRGLYMGSTTTTTLLLLRALLQQ